MKLLRLYGERSPLKFGFRGFCKVGSGLTGVVKSPESRFDGVNRSSRVPIFTVPAGALDC